MIYRYIRSIIIYLVFPVLAYSQIPTNPNLRDSKNLKQGKWTILYDENWDKVKNVDSAVFYRLIEYRNSIPIGITKDFYRNGRLQMEGEFYDEENWKANGIVNSYNEYGDLYDQEFYVNGNFNYSKSLPLMLELADKHKTNKGSNNSTYAQILCEIAEIYGINNDIKTSKSYLLQSINTYLGLKKLSKEESKELANTLDELAGIYSELALLDSAKFYHENALTKIELTFGKSDINYAAFQNNLASYYFDKNDMNKAMDLYRNSLFIYKKKKGVLYDNYISTFSNIGYCHQANLNYDSAVYYLDEASRLTKELNGIKSYKFTQSQVNLANLYCDMSKFDMALNLLLECQKFYIEMKDENELNYAEFLNELAGVYLDKEDYINAKANYQKALSIKQKQLGVNHLDCAVQYNNLAIVSSDLGNNEKAEEYYLKSLEITKNVIGTENTTYAFRLDNLGQLYQDMEKYEEAETAFKNSIKVYKNILTIPNNEYKSTLENLASLYEELKQFEKAYPLLRESLEISLKTSGKKSLNYVNSLENLGELYDEMDLNKDADSIYTNCMQLFIDLNAYDKLEFASFLNTYGLFYSKLNNFSKSIDYFNHSLSLYEKLIGNNLSYNIVLGNLADAYEAQGNTLEAEKIRTRVEILDKKLKSADE